MFLALSFRSFPSETSLDEAIRGTVAAGFTGLELPANDCGPLAVDMPEDRCRGIGTAIRTAGLRVAAVSFSPSGLASPDSVTRRAAIHLMRAALQRVAWLRGGSLILHAVPDKLHGDISQRAEETWNRLREALLELRFDAEESGAVLALSFPAPGVCGPAELREFLDELTTPWVGAHLVLDEPIVASGGAAEWIEMLGPRVRTVSVRTPVKPIPGQSAELHALGRALQAVQFAGPVILEGSGDLFIARRRFDEAIGAAPQAGQA